MSAWRMSEALQSVRMNAWRSPKKKGRNVAPLFHYYGSAYEW
jgi:hypothetical protein